MYYGIGKNDGGENMYILLCAQFPMYKAPMEWRCESGGSEVGGRRVNNNVQRFFFHAQCVPG